MSNDGKLGFFSSVAARRRVAALLFIVLPLTSTACSVESLTSREAVLTSVVLGASPAGIGAAGARGRRSLSTVVPVAGAIGAGVGLLTGAMMHESRNPKGNGQEEVVVVRKPLLRSENQGAEDREIEALRGRVEQRKWNPGQASVKPTLTGAARLSDEPATVETFEEEGPVEMQVPQVDDEEEPQDYSPYQGPSS